MWQILSCFHFIYKIPSWIVCTNCVGVRNSFTLIRFTAKHVRTIPKTLQNVLDWFFATLLTIESITWSNVIDSHKLVPTISLRHVLAKIFMKHKCMSTNGTSLFNLFFNKFKFQCKMITYYVWDANPFPCHIESHHNSMIMGQNWPYSKLCNNNIPLQDHHLWFKIWYFTLCIVGSCLF